jgi:hypothetical protein
VVTDDLEDAALARCKPVVVGRTVGKRMELGHDRLRWPAGLAPLASLAGSAFVRHGCPLSVVIDLVGTVALTGDSFKQLFECFAVLSAGGCRKSLRRSIELLFEPLDSLWRASWATWLTRGTVGSAPFPVGWAREVGWERHEFGWAQMEDGSLPRQVRLPV